MINFVALNLCCCAWCSCLSHSVLSTVQQCQWMHALHLSIV